MSLRKTWTVLVKESRHIIRDPASLILLLLAPAMLLIIMSYGMVADVRNVPITIIDNSRSALSRQFIDTLANSQDIFISRIAANYDDAERYFDRNQIKGLVVIPTDFAGQIGTGRKAAVQIIVDGTDPTTAEHLIKHVVTRSQVFGLQAALKTAGRAVPLEQIGLAGDPDSLGIEIRTRTWYNPDLKNVHGIVPAMIAMVMSLPAVVVMNAFVREKEHGTLEGVFATPLKRSELLIGKLLPYTFVGLLSIMLCVLVAITLFGVPFRGDFGLFLFLSLLFLLALYSMGLFFSIFLSNQAASSLVGLLLFMFPGFFLSGMFYPVASFPDLVREEAGWLPSTHFVAISRGLMVKGQGLEALSEAATMLVVLTVMMITLSVFFFKKKLK